MFYQGGTQYSSQSPSLKQNNYPAQQQQGVPVQQSYRPLKPLDISSVGTGSPLASPALNQTPQGFRSATPSGPKGWAPVQSPTTPLGPGAQKYFGASPTQGYQSQPQPSLQQYQQPNQYPSQPSGFVSQAPPQQYQAPPQQYPPQPAAQPVPAQSQIPAKPAVAQPQV